MREQPLAELLAAEAAARDFTGWDLSSIGMRELGGPPPWDYEAEARELLGSAHRAVDLGTGGGEVLLRIAGNSRASVVATEQWGPNARLAHSRLRAHGIPLVWCEAESTRMPFADDAFDLVLDRHEALEPTEVARILAPGGTVLTQQVTSRTMPELHQYIPRATTFPDHDKSYAESFRNMGFAVNFRRYDYRVSFPDLAALVRFLVIAPWTVPEFDLGRDLEALRAIERDLTTDDGIVFSDGRYILRAVKPGLF
jgi:SAM-dependent methyltransferase